MNARNTLIFFFVLMAYHAMSQSIDKLTLLQGDWFACGINQIDAHEVATFSRAQPACQVNDCLSYKWTFSGKRSFYSNWQQGCSEISMGMSKDFTMKYNAKTDVFTLTDSGQEQQYKIVALTADSCQVLRMK